MSKKKSCSSHSTNIWQKMRRQLFSRHSAKAISAKSLLIYLIADCWRDVLQTGFHNATQFSSTDGLCKLFDKIEPTNKKVLGMIGRLNETMTSVTSSEQEALKYLKRFVRGMEMTA